MLPMKWRITLMCWLSTFPSRLSRWALLSGLSRLRPSLPRSLCGILDRAATLDRARGASEGLAVERSRPSLDCLKLRGATVAQRVARLCGTALASGKRRPQTYLQSRLHRFDSDRRLWLRAV